MQPERTSSRTEGEETVLLALVELAREQASELAVQNQELRRQNEELARANRRTSEFLTTMSHELRTPLNTILGFAEILQEHIGGELSATQTEYVGHIRRAGENLLGLINDLLDLAKIDAGRMSVRRELLDLVVPVRQAVGLVSGMALRKQQRLELVAERAVPCVADAQRVRQVALNLLSNAVKFTPKGGLVRVTVAADGEGVRVEVADSGIGIDRRHHAAIFEAFRQVDSGETREYQGTGLGLALVARFCAAMQGAIELESELGRGATFRVRLPAPPAVDGRELVGLCADPGAAPALRERLVALGFAVDDLGPADAFVWREGTRGLVVDLTPDDRDVALERARSLGGEGFPVLVVQGDGAGGWDAFVERLRPAATLGVAR